MKILIIALVCAVLLTLAFLAVFLLRRTLYNMIDRRIERFQSELIEKQVLKYRICTSRSGAGGTITVTTFRT